jgi:hypothetical protein
MLTAPPTLTAAIFVYRIRFSAARPKLFEVQDYLKCAGQPTRRGVMNARGVTLNDVPMPASHAVSLEHDHSWMHRLSLLPSRSPPTNALSTHCGHEALGCRTRIPVRPLKKSILCTCVRLSRSCQRPVRATYMTAPVSGIGAASVMIAHRWAHSPSPRAQARRRRFRCPDIHSGQWRGYVSLQVDVDLHGAYEPNHIFPTQELRKSWTLRQMHPSSCFFGIVARIRTVARRWLWAFHLLASYNYHAQ